MRPKPKHLLNPSWPAVLFNGPPRWDCNQCNGSHADLTKKQGRNLRNEGFVRGPQCVSNSLGLWRAWLVGLKVVSNWAERSKPAAILIS